MAEDSSSRNGTTSSQHGTYSSKSTEQMRPKRNYSAHQSMQRRHFRNLAEEEIERIKHSHSDKRTAWKAISKDLRDQLVALHMEVKEETPQKSAVAVDEMLNNAVQRNTARGRTNWEKVAARLTNTYKNLYVDFASKTQA